MKITKVELHGVVLVVAGVLLASMLYPGITNASILSGIDEPTGNAYDDVYVAEEENATSTSISNQTANQTATQNSTGVQK